MAIELSAAHISLGRVNVWYRPDPDLDLRGPFSLVAKFVDSFIDEELLERATIDGYTPILLGMNFLRDHRCHTAFDSHFLRNGGVMVFP